MKILLTKAGRDLSLRGPAIEGKNEIEVKKYISCKPVWSGCPNTALMLIVLSEMCVMFTRVHASIKTSLLLKVVCHVCCSTVNDNGESMTKMTQLTAGRKM